LAAPQYSDVKAPQAVKAIFDTRPDTAYDDEIAKRYHFPNRYLSEADKALNDWIVYRETGGVGGRKAYIAVARVSHITPDPSRPKFSYAIMRDFLAFDAPVPLRGPGRYYETRLENLERRSQIGLALRGKSIRVISDQEFGSIAYAGFPESIASVARIPAEMGYGHTSELEVRDFVHESKEEQERRIDQILINRPFRDAAFRKLIVEAYDGRCAVTGLRIINGGGRAEVQAAHIWPVAEGGPDIIQNGIALSSTCHWLFDRHMICLTDSYRLLVSHNRIPEELRNLFTAQGDHIHLPKDERLWPKREYMARHRERFGAT